jgi:hypothetical protein
MARPCPNGAPKVPTVGPLMDRPRTRRPVTHTQMFAIGPKPARACRVTSGLASCTPAPKDNSEIDIGNFGCF